MPDNVKMPAYIGTKIVRAKLLTRNAFADRKGREQPEGERNFDVHGYLVVYPDGYESWSPKDVFEAAYRPVSDDERRMV